VSVRLITLTIVGFILGAFAAGGIGVRVIREVRALDDATSLPAENIARADGYHVDPEETLIASVALIPNATVIGDEGLVVAYDLVSLSPMREVEAPDGGPPLYPKRWVAEALGGEFEGVLSDPGDTSVTFPLLAGGAFDQIDSVRVVEAFIPAPFEARVSVGSQNRTASVAGGIEIELTDEVPNEDSVTIEVRIIADPDIAIKVLVVGDGPGWHAASVDGDTVTLVREIEGNTDDASGDPSPFDLVVTGTSWVPVDGDFVVSIGAGDE